MTADAGETQSWLRNAWYMAGWRHELDQGPVVRRVLDTAVFIFRGSDGVPAALHDRCPHRFAPLSRGRIDGDVVRCGYHGLGFDSSGACVGSILSGRVPALKVRTFPLEERDDILWIWMGIGDAADPALIPDFGFLPEGAGSRTLKGVLDMKAHYELGTDNLMDLSHIEFLHTGSFAGGGIIFRGEHSVERNQGTVWSRWSIIDIEPPSGARRGQFPDGTRVDHWLDMRWNAPASMRLEVGSTPAGCSRDDGYVTLQAHILTPATADLTHYFWATTRTFRPESSELDEQIKVVLTRAFVEEDKPMIEAIHANMDGRDFWSLDPRSIATDAGGLAVRRALAKLIEQDQEGRQTQDKAAR